MTGISPEENSERTLLRLREMIYRYYGRDASPRGRRPEFRLSFYEASLFISGSAGSMHTALALAGTSFHIEHLNGRLDVLLAGLLVDPNESPLRAWAQRYGFGSPGVASRAFRARYGVGLGDVRRMARVHDWLRASSSRPIDPDREQEAWLRVTVLRRKLEERGLGPRAAAALEAFGSDAIARPARRPRYPPLRPQERSWIAEAKGAWTKERR